MARRRLREIVKEARKQERARRPARIDHYSGWLLRGLDEEPDEFTRDAHFRIGDTRDQLIIEFEFPNLPIHDPNYERVLAEMSLRCVYHCLQQDPQCNIGFITFVSDQLTLDISRARFETYDLESIDPIVLANQFGARLTEPTLDITQRVEYLTRLTPRQFESLIIKTFENRGLDVRPISHDSHGIECLAFDRTPMIGGKVVIHASRDLELVGVPDLEILLDDVHRRNAVKGIFVTISDFWPGTREWADEHRLELIAGPQLARASGGVIKAEIAKM